MNEYDEYNEFFYRLDKAFQQDPNLIIDERKATLLMELAIENDDLAVINLLVNKNIKLNEKIMGTLPYAGEEKFFLIVECILKNQPDFKWGLYHNFLENIVKSKSSTVKMLSFSFDKLGFKYDSELYYILLMCFLKRNDLMNYMLNENFDFITKEYNGKKILYYIEEYLSLENYIKASNLLL